MRKGTVCFITRNQEVLLILIEYSPTDRKWTGIGGMVEEGESLTATTVREAAEESHIVLQENKLQKVAEINNPDFQLNVFLTDSWSGELKAKEPSLKEFRWFNKNELPFNQMHPGNEKWLPHILNGKLLKITGDEIDELNG